MSNSKTKHNGGWLKPMRMVFLKTGLSPQTVRLPRAAPVEKSWLCCNSFVVNRWNNGYSVPLRGELCCNALPPGGRYGAPEQFSETEAIPMLNGVLSWSSPPHSHVNQGPKQVSSFNPLERLKGGVCAEHTAIHEIVAVCRPFQPAN